MILLLLAVLAAFVAGVLTGVFVVSRNAHRLVARLPRAERMAFARKVNTLARR